VIRAISRNKGKFYDLGVTLFWLLEPSNITLELITALFYRMRKCCRVNFSSKGYRHKTVIKSGELHYCCTNL
jgi:hypothetical protein